MTDIKKPANSSGKTGRAYNKTIESSQSNSSTLNLYDAIEAFKSVLAENNLGILNEIKIDAGLQRFGKSKEYWYTFHSGDICAGAYGNWKTGLNENWHFKKDSKPLTADERKALAVVYADAKKKRLAETEKKYAMARRVAHASWVKASPANADHPYIIKKQIQGIESHLKIDARGNLLVPIYNQKRLVSLQYINQHGGKFFVKGSELKKSFFVFKSPIKPLDEIFICEGISTAATLHFSLTDKATVFSALSAGNLKAVALSVRSHYPDTKIIIACDNDYKDDGSINIGVEKGKEAAQAIGGFYSIPQFVDPTQSGDWNDLFLSTQSKAVGQ